MVVGLTAAHCTSRPWTWVPLHKSATVVVAHCTSRPWSWGLTAQVGRGRGGPLHKSAMVKGAKSLGTTATRPFIFIPPPFTCISSSRLLYRLVLSYDSAEAYQSSMSSGGEASRAIDGNKNTNYFSGSCSHTSSELKPYWYVNIGIPRTVKGVRITNRADCCCEYSLGTVVIK